MDSHPRRRPALRARLVILRAGPSGQEVLLVRHTHPDRSFWCFPGGGVEPGETVVQAACREAREEVGLDVVPAGIVYLQDRVGADALDLFVLARTRPGEPVGLGTDPEREGAAPVLTAARWAPVRELPGLTVLPRGLADLLAAGHLPATELPDTAEGSP